MQHIARLITASVVSRKPLTRGLNRYLKLVSLLSSYVDARKMIYSLTVKWTNCTYSSTTSTIGPHILTIFRLLNTLGSFSMSSKSMTRACSSSWIVRGVVEHPIHPRSLRAFSFNTGGFRLLIRARTLP